MFEKTLIGGFSSVNTRLDFDTKILLSQNENLKVIYYLKIDEKKKKRIVSKILKMDENNQYGNAITKPLPYGCIQKEKEIPSLKKLNFILETLSINDKIGHLFVVDICFYQEIANKETLLFNEIYTPIFEKKKIIKPFEKSVLQLQLLLRKNQKGDLKTFKFNGKTHSSMEKKIFYSTLRRTSSLFNQQSRLDFHKNLSTLHI